MQYVIFEQTARDPNWKPPVVSELPQWPENGAIGFDLETRDPKLRVLGPGVRRDAYIVGFSFTLPDRRSYYVPLRHEMGDNVPNPEAALQYLRDQAKRFRGPESELVGANLQYDLDFTEEAGIEFRPKWIRDIQVADPLIYELYDSYSMDAISKRRNIGFKDEDELRHGADLYQIDPKVELWRMPAQFVSKYAMKDSSGVLDIMDQQKKEIARDNLQGIFDLESRLLPVLLKMRRRGILIDQDQLARVEQFAVTECNKSLAEISSITGRVLAMDEVMAAAAVAPVLKAIGAQVPTTASGKPSIDKDFLKTLDHPVAKQLARARRLYKLKNTFVASIREHMVKGRIHTTFNQLRGASAQGDESEFGEEENGARYGRLSSCDPNLQQQPSKDPEFAKMWRSIYIPEPGCLWGANDFSQQEPRVLTHYAEITGCKKAREFGDLFRSNPKADTYDSLVKMTKASRNDCKLIYLGMSYSMGPPKLCHTLKLPTVWKPDSKTGTMREYAGPEGEALFKTFHEGAPFIRQLDYKIRDRIQEIGYITTLLGRRIHFPLREVPHRNPWNGRIEKYDWAQKGLNRLIQGGSADQVKKAVVDLDDAGHYLQLQVHDECGGSVESAKVAEEQAEIMRNAVKLTVPMRVDTEIGPSWGGSMG